jgi:hypothetical protein
MATRKEANCRRSAKCRVTIDPGKPRGRPRGRRPARGDPLPAGPEREPEGATGRGGDLVRADPRAGARSPRRGGPESRRRGEDTSPPAPGACAARCGRARGRARGEADLRPNLAPGEAAQRGRQALLRCAGSRRVGGPTDSRLALARRFDVEAASSLTFWSVPDVRSSP